MSSSNETLITASRSIIDTLNLIQARFVNQLPLIFIILGSIGFLGNVFTFLQPSLRSNTFCIYSLLGSFIDIIGLFINLLPNYISNGVSSVKDTVICKCTLFSLVFFPQLSINLLVLCLIDRFACTCSLTSPMRRIRQLKMVPLLFSITVIISGVMSLYSPLLYDFIPGIGCVTVNALSNAISYIIIHGFISPILMLVFVFLTFRNIQESRQRVGVVTNAAATQRSRQQFIGMVFSQVFVTSFCILQWISIYIAYLATQYDTKTEEQWAIFFFIFSLSNNLYYIIHVKSFYLSTLASRLFREALIKGLYKLINKTAAQRQDLTRTQTMIPTIARSMPKK